MVVSCASVGFGAGDGGSASDPLSVLESSAAPSMHMPALESGGLPAIQGGKKKVSQLGQQRPDGGRLRG